MQLRRIEREVAALADISDILDRCEVGHLGVTDTEGPYVVPLSFVHVVRDGRIVVYAHGAAVGRKIAAIGSDPRVCFEAEIRIRTIVTSDVTDLSVAYESVVGSGTARIVTDAAEARTALALLIEKYVPGRGDELPAKLPPVAVLAFDLDAVMGKHNLG